MSPRSWSFIRVVSVILSSLLFIIDLTIAHTCNRSSSSYCPPFTSPPSFPFASSPGCGHPSFQIHCSSPHSIISINNLSFALLHHEPNSTSLLLSPQPSPIPNTTQSPCPTIPSTSTDSFFNPITSDRSIDLSGSPFRFSDASCSRLSLLQPCEPLSPPNCTQCPWECEVHNNPVRLLSGCRSKRRPVSDQGCQEDVLGYLRSFLKLGIQVEWDENGDPYFSSCQDCQTKNGVCGFNSSDPRQPFLCFDSQTKQFPARDSQNRTVLFCSLFIFISLVVVVGVLTLIFRLRGLESPKSEEDPTTLFLHRHRSANLLPPVFTYEDLEASTSRFDPSNKIGDGGFGSVYIGQLTDGRIVAVKKLHRQQAMATSTKAFCNEILILSSIEHPNLVKLHGYCSDPRGLVLVYDYVQNGTLADHLHGSKSSLKWVVRVEVALQTAMALEYLHFSVEPAIVHRDITSSNIFVDKDMKIKVGDFGLSRLLVLPEESSSKSSSGGFVWTGPQGTPGYLDPEYHRSFRLTEKSDVYSFGVVLFELISGMKAVDLSRDKREVSLADMVVSRIQVGSLHQVVDPFLLLESGGDALPLGTVDAMAELAFRCVAVDKDDRPDARELVAELKRIRNRTRGH